MLANNRRHNMFDFEHVLIDIIIFVIGFLFGYLLSKTRHYIINVGDDSQGGISDEINANQRLCQGLKLVTLSYWTDKDGKTKSLTIFKMSYGSYWLRVILSWFFICKRPTQGIKK